MTDEGRSKRVGRGCFLSHAKRPFVPSCLPQQKECDNTPTPSIPTPPLPLPPFRFNFICLLLLQNTKRSRLVQSLQVDAKAIRINWLRVPHASVPEMRARAQTFQYRHPIEIALSGHPRRRPLAHCGMAARRMRVGSEFVLFVSSFSSPFALISLLYYTPTILTTDSPGTSAAK